MMHSFAGPLSRDLANLLGCGASATDEDDRQKKRGSACGVGEQMGEQTEFELAET